MAIYNEIEAQRYSRMLQKLFGIKGGAPVRQLAGEIAPIFNVFAGRENLYLEDWRPFGARFSVNAVAAQNSAIRFSNPLGSNIICVIEAVEVESVASGSAVELFVEQTTLPAPTTNLSAVNTPCLFDGRFGQSGTGGGGAAGAISGANNVGAPAFVTWADLLIPQNTFVELINTVNQEWPVTPGTMFQARTLTLNVNLTMTVRWRERLLEESERT